MGWCWLCVRGELETGTDCHILTQSSSGHSSTSFAFWRGCSTVDHWGPKAIRLPLALNSASCLQLIPTTTGTRTASLTQACCGTWLYNYSTSTSFLWAYASAPNSTPSIGQGDIPISSTGCTCFTVLLLIYTSAFHDWRLGRGSTCSDAILPISKRIKDINTFNKCISRNVNIIPWLEFEPAYYEVTV